MIDNIKAQIFGNKKKQEQFKEEDIIRIHDVLMVEYGWIPLEEFRNLPMPTMLNLLNCINKRHEEEEKQMNKSKKGKR
jgi:hypothetical protein